jgi:hypothetical protein
MLKILNNKKKLLLIAVGVVFLISTIFGVVDYNRVKYDQKPLFIIYSNKFLDGGTVEYYGLGYKILKCKTLSGDNSKKIGFYNLKYSCDNTFTDDNDYKGLCVSDIIEQVEVVEDEYYWNNQNSQFPYTINIQEKSNCTNSKDLYYENNDTNTCIYLYCLNDVTINFDDKIISLKEALETNRINIEDIISYIPYQEHIYYSISRYVYGGEYGLSNEGFAIYKCNAFNVYYIGTLSMCSEQTFCDFFIKDSN